MISVDSILANEHDIVDLIELCRLCGNYQESALPLFDDTCEQKYWELVNIYFKEIQVCRSDILPLNICHECVKSITSWNAFYLNSVKVNEKFQAVIHKFNLPTNHKTCEVTRLPLFDDMEVIELGVDKFNLPTNLKTYSKVTRLPLFNNIEVIELGIKENAEKDFDDPDFKNDNIKVDLTDSPIAVEDHYFKDFQTMNDSIKDFEENPSVDPLIAEIKTKFELDKDPLHDESDEDWEQIRSTKCSICGSVFMKSKVHNAKNRGICYSCYRKMKNGSKNKHKNVFSTFNRYLFEDENKQAYFQCDLCSFSCEPFPDVFTHHYRTKHPDSILFLYCFDEMNSKDDDCSGKFLKKTKFGNAYQCDKCDFECLPVKEIFLKHYNSHKEVLKIEPIPDVKEQINFINAIALQDSKFSCLICNKVYDTLTYARRHLRRVHRAKKFQCEICGLGFTFKHKAIIHQKRHLKEKKFMCEICGRTFIAKYNLEAHVKKNLCCKYICYWCDKLFYKKAILRKHLTDCEKQSYEFRNEEEIEMIFGGKNTSKYECANCSKKFPSKVALEIHLIEENNLTPFECQYCDEKYSSRELLKSHAQFCARKFSNRRTRPFKMNDEKYLVKINGNMYSCAVCDKKCRKLEYLKQHLRSHTGEKPYVCQFCGKAYAFKSSLTSHMLTEMNLRRYVCSVCGKRYNTSSHLTAHTKKHHRLRDFKCSACDKAFAYSRELEEHMKSHTEEKQFFCDKCGGFFKTERYLKVHWERCSILQKN